MKNKLNIYVGHSRDFDYESLYQSILNSKLIEDYNFLFPHKLDKNSRNGRFFYKKENIDIFIAEVSKPSTGLGIEVGFAYEEKIPIYAFHESTTIPSNAILRVTNSFIPYKDMEDFVNILKGLLYKDE